MTKANDWQYICIGCGKVVMAGADFAGSCPDCGGTRWCCHWFKDASKPSEAQEVGDKPSAPMIPQTDNMSQLFVEGQNNGRNKTGPKPLPVEDLVKKLAGQGLSSRMIAAKLNEQGISVSYKTIQRRIQGAFL